MMRRAPRKELQQEFEHTVAPVNLERLCGADVAMFAGVIRGLAAEAMSRQDLCESVVDLFYESFRAPHGGTFACVLARCFQTCHYARLPTDYQHAADVLLDEVASHPGMRCLALMATRGTRRVWNDVATSMRHQCIPLPSVEVVERAPMVARLLGQLGVSVESLVAIQGRDVAPGELVSAAAAESKTLQAFHIEKALGSPFVPAQAEFVEPYAVESVVGLGGVLEDGDIFALILFTRVRVSKEVAATLQELAPVLREVLVSIPGRNTFSRLRE